MHETLSIVTAIPYVNSVPHIGTSLDLVGADICARYGRMRGMGVWFLAGSDENGLKIREAAEAAGKDTQAFVDEISQKFVDVWAGLGVSYDEWVRTTEPRHIRATQEVFRRLQENGYVYKGVYEGWYDVSAETFFKESDLIDGKSPNGNEVRWVSEENYFFKLSAFAEPLLKHLEENPDFIIPASRKNEVVSFIKSGLHDASISRTNPGWGIPVPGDEGKIVYVWFDAVINYVTGTGWPDAPDWETKWPATIQWLGKDIMARFHATLWPAMLMGAGLPLPKHLVVHGWILMGKDKISKSRGNVVAPLDLAASLAADSGCSSELAVDAVRHYMAATMPYDGDSTYTREDFDTRYNADLANDLGNALNRSLAMAHKFVEGKIPGGDAEPDAMSAIGEARAGYDEAMSGFRVDHAVDSAWNLIRFLNKYIDTRAPWALAKSGDPALPAVMRSMLLCLRSAEGMIRPTMPHAADALAAQLGLPPLTDWGQIGAASSLPAGTALSQPQPLFPRIQPNMKESATPKDPVAATPAPTSPKPVAPAGPPAEITIEDFAKVQLRVGRVLEAENLEGSDKLLKLQVMLGDDKRQIVAGIRKGYQPVDLIGRQVVVVANLKPAKLRGTDSQGMLLAAVDEDGAAILLQPDREAPEGATVR